MYCSRRERQDVGGGRVLIMIALLCFGVVVVYAVLTAPRLWDLMNTEQNSVMWVQPSADIPLNEHALKEHAQAEDVRESILKCPNSDLHEYIGVSDFKNFVMWGCWYKGSTKVAFWVVVAAGNGGYRTVTAFISRSWDYAQNLIDGGKYILEQPK